MGRTGGAGLALVEGEEAAAAVVRVPAHAVARLRPIPRAVVALCARTTPPFRTQDVETVQSEHPKPHSYTQGERTDQARHVVAAQDALDEGQRVRVEECKVHLGISEQREEQLRVADDLAVLVVLLEVVRDLVEVDELLFGEDADHAVAEFLRTNGNVSPGTNGNVSPAGEFGAGG